MQIAIENLGLVGKPRRYYVSDPTECLDDCDRYAAELAIKANAPVCHGLVFAAPMPSAHDIRGRVTCKG
jgi:hypothetical protein